MTPFDGPPSVAVVASPGRKKSRIELPKPLTRAQVIKRLEGIFPGIWYQSEDPELARVGTVLACLWEALAHGGLDDKAFRAFLGRAETLARAQGLMIKAETLRERYDYAVAAADAFLESGNDPLALADVVEIRLKSREDTAQVLVWTVGVQVEKLVEAAGTALDTSRWLELMRKNKTARRSGRTVVDLAIEASQVSPAIVEKMHDTGRKKRARDLKRGK